MKMISSSVHKKVIRESERARIEVNEIKTKYRVHRSGPTDDAHAHLEVDQSKTLRIKYLIKNFEFNSI